MAHLWSRSSSGWDVCPLAEGMVRISPARGGGVRLHPAPEPDQDMVLIHHQFDGDGADLWSLLAPPGERVRVNGQELLAGVRVLRDRDEVVLGREEPVYFSTQTLAVARPFEGAPHPIYCPRCQGLVEAGQMVVCCPGCHTVYHQFPERACWTYADKCCHCRRGTALEGGYDWTPEGI